LFRKEWRELMAARSFGRCSHASGRSSVSPLSAPFETTPKRAGAGVGCGIVCAPLIGIWTPTFGVRNRRHFPAAVRRFGCLGRSVERRAEIELQRPLSPFLRLGVKTAVLLAGW
jgi:hypothetical protein